MGYCVFWQCSAVKTNTLRWLTHSNSLFVSLSRKMTFALGGKDSFFKWRLHFNYSSNLIHVWDRDSQNTMDEQFKKLNICKGISLSLNVKCFFLKQYIKLPKERQNKQQMLDCMRIVKSRSFIFNKFIVF